MKSSVYNKIRAVPEDVWLYDTNGPITQSLYHKKEKKLKRKKNSASRLTLRRYLQKDISNSEIV